MLRTVSIRCSSLALLGGASCVALAAPAFAQSQEAPPPEQAEPAAPDIIVTGIRASLESANRAKEQSAQVKDVISAEDIGKLPDTNVAESLQRVTGVQINRDLGEGSEIAVRGFSQNRVEINGQTQGGSGAQGGVSFNAIPSEAFKSIEVIKTPAADEIEGALGAIVRFNTRKPLDNRGKLIFSASAQAQYAERADEWTPNFSVTASKGWDVGDGEFGALVSYTRKDRKLRQDFYDTRGWEAVNSTRPDGTGLASDLDGDGVIGEPIKRDALGNILDLQDGIYVPFQSRVRAVRQNRKLESWTTALQYKPSPRTEIYFNGTYSRNRAKDSQYQVTSNLSNTVTPDPRGGLQLGAQYATPKSLVISPDRTVLSAFLGSFSTRGVPAGVPFNIAASSNPPQQRIWNAQLGAKWEATETLRAEVQVAAGRGRQYNQFINTTSGLLAAERPFFFYDFSTDDDIPALVPLNPIVNGVRTTEFSDAARFDFDRIGIYQFNNIAVNRERQRNRDTALRIDFDWDVESDFLKSFEFGARFANVSAERSRLRGRDGPGAADGTFGNQTYAAIDATEPGFITTLPFDDLLDGASGDFPRSFFVVDPKYAEANLDAIFTKYGISFRPDGTYGFRSKRTDTAAYLKANFEFDLGTIPVFGNYGLRYIKSKGVSEGPVPGGTQTAPTLTLVTARNSFSRFLPSFNVVAEPFDRTYVRFGAAKAIARPELIDVSPLLIISDSFDRARGGNPDLRPEEVTQFDLSLEKYYGKGNLIAVAGFYKRFNQRIEDGIGTTCLPIAVDGLEQTPANDGCLLGQDQTRLEQPLNFGKATVKGIEASWQQTFDFLPSPLDGFGFIANYTFVDAGGGSVSATGRVLPVQDLSRHSYNLIGFYEKGGLQMRAAYNWRSKFYDERTDTNQASFAKPYGQLDASINYDVTKNISVGVEGLNLLNRPEERYQELTERRLAYRVNDRRFLFGIRIKN